MPKLYFKLPYKLYGYSPYLGWKYDPPERGTIDPSKGPGHISIPAYLYLKCLCEFRFILIYSRLSAKKSPTMKKRNYRENFFVSTLKFERKIKFTNTYRSNNFILRIDI